jgi:hypothetical protein
MTSLIDTLKQFYRKFLTSERRGPYHHVVLAKLGTIHDVHKLRQELEKDFIFVKTLVRKIKGVSVISELRGTVPELLIQADTLYASISPTKATLFQKTSSPFTLRDRALRKQILRWYPNTFTIFLAEQEPQYSITPEARQ